eukprot:13707287-Ditylum_brightwellii.AAC.1
MKHATSSILADKGEGINKRDGASFVKLNARWCKKEQQIKTRNFGIHTTANTSDDDDAGIDYTLIPYGDDDDEERGRIKMFH